MVGQTIAQYKILDKLGEGGMGVVYKAEDTRLDRTVALKFLPHHLTANDTEKARFLQEAKAAAALNHPNVCAVIDIQETDGTQFIIMEFVDGVTLKQKLPVAGIDEVVHYALQIGEALQEAHRKGIVHRDIKSENIMVTGRGQVKVMDFGLAKLRGSLKLTRTSSTVGTLAYMAPEQIQGNEADARSDIFSFGVVLHEMLAGKTPFRGEHEAAIMYSILNEDPDPPARSRSDVPAYLAAIIAKCLQKDPARRYQTFGEIIGELRQSSQAPAAPPQRKEQESTSIAVLAFEDMSPQKDQDYLCEGLAEEIINALTKLNTLRVSARTSAFAFKGKQLDIREIGSKLNVQSVLEGSVRKSGNRVRITAQLVNVADGYHKWSERYDRELRDVFEIQDEITENIVRALKLVLTEREKASLDSTSTSSVEAFEYYLRGRRLFHQHIGKEEKAIQMFERAAEIDPNYADAHCGLADCYTFRYLYRERTREMLGLAESASRRAAELRPDLAEAHASLGFVLAARKEFDTGDREFEKAIKLNPRLFETWYYYGRTCFVRGDFARAAKYFEEASRMRPEDFQSMFLLADVYRSLGNQEAHSSAIRAGIQRAERHLELNPDDVRALYMTGGAYSEEPGQSGKGEQFMLRALELDPHNAGTQYNCACGFARLGKLDRAIECLEMAIKGGFAHREWLEHDGDFESLRSHPRFQELVASVK